MIIDFQQVSMLAGSIATFENQAIAAQPTPPSDIKEFVYLKGENTGGDIVLGGTADSPQ